MPRILPTSLFARFPVASSSLIRPLAPIAASGPSLKTTAATASSLLSRRSISSSLLNLTTPRSTLSLGPGVAALQIRSLTYGTNYQPSQRKRKNKHGFLSRIRGGRLGRKTIGRRLAKGRRFLSH